MSVSYTPGFQHQDWVDNVDRVQAGGDNGFNIRFHALESEFGQISTVVSEVSTALDALAQKPPAQELKATFTPNLVQTSTNGWTHLPGLAQKPPAQTSAAGMMSIDLPGGAKIESLRVTGRNSGSGSLRIILQRQQVSSSPTAAQQISRVETAGDPFDMSVAADSQFATVDTAQYKYFITVQVDNAQPADVVQVSAFQIAYQSS